MASGDPRWKVTVSSAKRTDERRSRIAEVDCRLYQQRGREDGHALEDWLEAERLVVNQEPWQHFILVHRLVLASLSKVATRNKEALYERDH